MNMELQIGDVLWQMQAREQNGICKWYAAPHCIEFIDEHKILFENRCGGSRNYIEKKWFKTRQEAMDNFLESHESLEMPLQDDEDDNLIVHLPRTDFQDMEVCRDDTVDTTSIYLGGFDRLENITDRFRWHEEYYEGLYMNVGTLTLSEIYEQSKNIIESDDRMLTVFCNSMLHGEIYQCGNHEEGKWEKIGETRGYA